MINENKTLELFDYISNSLFKGSNKKIIRDCDNCGKSDEVMFKSYNKQKYPNLCKICSHHVNPHPNYGKSMSYEQKEKISKTKKDKNLIGELNPNWKGGKVIKVCELCGKEFEVKPSAIGKFCSNKCHNKWMSINQNGSNNPSWKGGNIIKICEWCGNEFKSIPSQNHKFCSRKCLGIWRSKNIRRENHPNWKGGFNKYCYKFNELCREQNRDKYNRKCFICDKTEKINSQRLSVHHIDMNKNQGCKSEWKLVPLCKSCHGIVHNELWKFRIKYLINNEVIINDNKYTSG